ncbi:MAG: hypothetical protein ACO2PK_07135 [Armatimonadota bacterium]
MVGAVSAVNLLEWLSAATLCCKDVSNGASGHWSDASPNDWATAMAKGRHN